MLAVALVFAIMPTSAQAGWWLADVLLVRTITDPSIYYEVRVQHAVYASEITLYFTSKEMLATALTALSMNSQVAVKFDDVTLECWFFELRQ